MKRPTFSLFAIAALFSLAACGDDKPTRVVHETRVVHHYHSDDRHSDDRPSTPRNNPDDFEPVERPSTYSR